MSQDKAETLVCNNAFLLSGYVSGKNVHEKNIYSFSPSVIFDESFNARPLSSLADADRFSEFLASFFSELEICADNLDKSQELSPYRVLITKQFYMNTNVLFQALCLSGLEQSIAGNLVYLTDNRQDIISHLLKNRKRWAIVNGNCVTNQHAEKNDSRWSYEYLRLNGISSVVFKLMEKIPNRLKKSLTKSEILVYGHNELLKDLCFSFLKKGIPTSCIKKTRPKLVKLRIDELKALDEFLGSTVNRLYGSHLSPDLIENINSFIRLKIVNQLESQLSYQAYWESALDYIKNGKYLVFSNYPAKSDSIALANFCKSCGVKFIAFQHGVTRELSGLHINGSFCYENNVADILYTFNATATQVSNRIPFKQGQAKTLGAPSMFYRLKKGRARSGNQLRYLYVSTNVQIGDLGVPQGVWHDYDRTLAEIQLIKRCFSKLKHKIWIKSYPMSQLRYFGNNIIYNTASKYSNIKWIEKTSDLRFMLKDYDLLITSRATSTLSWCIMSGKPLIFINYAKDSALKKELTQIFKDSLFYFNANDNVYEQLLEFMNKPFSEILELWNDKSNHRKQLIDCYFFDNNRPENFKTAVSELSSYL